VIRVFQTPTFKKQTKKLHNNQTKALNSAIKDICDNPFQGQMKKGDLRGIRVYKFKMVNQLTLIAYQLNEKNLQINLLAFGSHENFYRGLKK